MTVAQFGLGNRGQMGGTSFQELQDLAKKQQEAAAGGGGAAGAGAGAAGFGGANDMAKFLEDAMKDPGAKEYLEKMGHDFGQAMDQLSKMTPEEMEKQMADVFGALTDDKMLDAIVGSKDDVLKQLEMTQMVPPDELVKMKADPEYFEQKMKESFGQMKDMFRDPQMAGYMSEALTGMSELFQQGGGIMKEIEQMVGPGGLLDDTTIEDARNALLQGDFSASGGVNNHPILKEMLEKEEFKALLQDTEKFRETIKEGRKVLGLGAAAGAARGVGAGIGEL